MEFLRFGSSIPGSYWGCCACCVIQDFNQDPDEKSSIQLVCGDSGSSIGDKFAGPTYRDIFQQRLRIGTFSDSDMPNHAFLAVLTDNQVSSTTGKKWLSLLKENGFEFVRTVSNSVYDGQKLYDGYDASPHPNYIFGLFRNIGQGKIKDQFTPPKQWTDLPQHICEPWMVLENATIQSSQEEYHLEAWNNLGKAKFLTKAQVKAAGAPVILAGQRSKHPQEPEEKHNKGKTTKTSPFGEAQAVAVEG